MPDIDLSLKTPRSRQASDQIMVRSGASAPFGADLIPASDFALAADLAATDAAVALKAPLASPAFTGIPTAPTATGGTNTTQIATTAFVDAAVNAIIAAADAMVFKGVVDCSANPNYPAADRGWTYKVSVAGKIGGSSGVSVEVGDTLLCLTDGTASGDQATVGAQWNITQANLDGAVIGPASSVDGYFALFSGPSGKLLQSVSPAAVKAALAIVPADISGFDAAVAASPAVVANTAKVSNATHTGDVTGSTALTIDKTAITGKTEVTAEAGVDYMLISDTSDGGNLKKALVPAGGGGSPTFLTSTATGAQDDWNPGTLGGQTLINWTGTAPIIIRGIAGASSGYEVTFLNGSTTVPAVIQVEATTSTATNRIAAQVLNPTHVIVLPGESVKLIYNGSRFVVGQLQGDQYRGAWVSTRPAGFAANGHNMGMDLTNLGNMTSLGVSGTTLQTNRMWWVINTTTTAGGLGGAYGSNALLVPATGFLAHVRFNFSTSWPDTADLANPGSANSTFFGLNDGSALGTLGDIASAAGSIAGWGRDPADANNLYAYHNDQAGAPVKVNLGASYPTLTAAAVYDGWVYMPPGGAALTMILIRADDIATAPSVEHYTTALPNAAMRHWQQITNRAAAVRYHARFSINEFWRN